jgi:hypothetical protein
VAIHSHNGTDMYWNLRLAQQQLAGGLFRRRERRPAMPGA